MNLGIDQTRFTGAGLHFEQNGSQGTFRLLVNGKPHIHALVQVPVVNGQVKFFPQRSAAQRQVLAMLGEQPS
jgi:hypothetical protein